MTKVDVAFNVYSDAKGRDPDKHSATLRAYHKVLWSKPLPDGRPFNLTDGGGYLRAGQFTLGSDGIAHSYKNQKRKAWIVQQIPDEVQEFFDICSTVGGYLIFPSNRIDNKPTINGARGMNNMIDDRIDLTLETIRRFYLGQTSPLYDTLLRYSDFFNAFSNFVGYVDHFLLNDLVDEQGEVKFFLPFDNFKTPPRFTGIDDYRIYKQNVIAFVTARNLRIAKYAEANLSG